MTESVKRFYFNIDFGTKSVKIGQNSHDLIVKEILETLKCFSCNFTACDVTDSEGSIDGQIVIETRETTPVLSEAPIDAQVVISAQPLSAAPFSGSQSSISDNDEEEGFTFINQDELPEICSSPTSALKEKVEILAKMNMKSLDKLERKSEDNEFQNTSHITELPKPVFKNFVGVNNPLSLKETATKQLEKNKEVSGDEKDAAECIETFPKLALVAQKTEVFKKPLPPKRKPRGLQGWKALSSFKSVKFDTDKENKGGNS